MFNETNEAEQNAKHLIEAIRKAMNKGDLKGALRRTNRVKAVADEKGIEKLTLGELLLISAGVARAGGKKDLATELVMEILHGKGGMSIEILGRAKRLRARLLLDENKLDEAEVLAGTADRYIVTGLMEEKVEQRAGHEYRVNVPVARKILDNGEFISFETFFLLAEIAILENNWEKAIWNIQRAGEKYSGDRLFPELEMWRGILAMARGMSFIEVIEPVFANGNAPAVLIGRIEALLGEARREDSLINEAEYDRFRHISELARRRPLLPIEPADVVEPVAKFETPSEQNPNSPDQFRSKLQNFEFGATVIEMDLSRLSMMRLVEIGDIERVTGMIALKWNEAAVGEGIAESILDKSALCGEAAIYCQQGRFIDADYLSSDADFTNLPADKIERSRFILKQILLIALGGGSKRLTEIQSGAAVDLTDGTVPLVMGAITRDETIAERENALQISSNLNFFLDVSKDLDEFRNGFSFDEEKEIDWDAAWGTSLTQTQPAEKTAVENSPVQILEHESATTADPFAQSNAVQTPPPAEPPFSDEVNFDFADTNGHSFRLSDKDDGDLLSLNDEDERNLTDAIDTNFDEIEFKASEDFFSGESAMTDNREAIIEKSVETAQDTADQSGDIAPPWSSAEPDSEEIVTASEQSSKLLPMELALSGEEIAGIIKAESWSKVNNMLANILSRKLSCSVRAAISRDGESFIAAVSGDAVEYIVESDGTAFNLECIIIEKIKWVLETDRTLEADELNFTENLMEIGKLTLLSLDHGEGKEVQSVGGVAIADDEWLARFMVPPRSLIMRKKINEIQVYAVQDGVNLPKAHLLLGGETGTGKDVFARLAHEMSGRRENKFVRADMGAVGGGDQFIATLFGAVKGAYTGQVGERRGLVEEAEGGTLFLNEIGNLSLESQRALLDFMQENCYTRLGDTKLRHANVRVILATNEDINDANKFRQDVKFRCAPPVVLPPLRDRREDIASLVESFAGDEVVLREAAIKLLEFQPWQGNVRQLSQVIKTAIAKIGGSGEVKASVIEEVLQNLNDGQNAASLSFPVPPSGMTYRDALESYEKFLLEHSLVVTGNKNSVAARLWGESPASITKKVKKWGVANED